MDIRIRIISPADIVIKIGTRIFLAFVAFAMGATPGLAQAPAPQAAPLPDAATLLKIGRPSGPQGDTYASLALLPDFGSTKWISENAGDTFGPCDYPPGVPPNPFTCLKLSWTKAWQTKFDAMKKIAEAGGDVTYRAQNCLPSGYTGNIGALRSIVEILLTPGQVTIIPETWQGRRIYTNGRKHPDDPEITFSGDNIGHWENGVLVSDTIGLSPEINLVASVPGGKNMHVVQRISMVDANTMQYVSVLEAPQALAQPRVTQGRLVRVTKWEMREDFCTENNRDIGASGEQLFDLTPPPLDP